MEAASKVHRRRCARGHHRADHLGASLRLGSALGVGRRPWNGLIYKVLGAAAGGEKFEITRGTFGIFTTFVVFLYEKIKSLNSLGRARAHELDRANAQLRGRMRLCKRPITRRLVTERPGS